MPATQRKDSGPRQRSILATLGLGYLLLLLSVLAFSAVCCVFDHTSLATGIDATNIVVHPMDDVTWVEWEKQYAENRILSGYVPMEAKHPLGMSMIYNFSIVPIYVRTTNEENVTYPSFEVSVLVEDETGHIRGYGSARPEVSASGARVVETVFLYNVPDLLRGQELRIHVVSMIQRRLVVDEEYLTVRTFPRIEWMELPRILLFFLAFSTLPVSAFLPSTLKRRAEGWWRLMLKKGPRVVILVILLSWIAFIAYWDVVCKMFSFL